MIVESPQQGCQVVYLTCPLCSEQILALGFVGIDGGDGHIIGRVWIQVFQELGRLVIVQNDLMRKTKLSVRKAAWLKKNISQTNTGVKSE